MLPAALPPCRVHSCSLCACAAAGLRGPLPPARPLLLVPFLLLQQWKGCKPVSLKGLQ